MIVALEKRGRGRGIAGFIARPWASRTFKLSGQILEYWDGDVLKGSINTAGCTCKALDKAEHKELKNKQYPFVLNTGSEELYLNATSPEVREKCIEVFSYSADISNWAFQY